MLLALGLSLVFSVMGLINFSYGSLIVWSGYAAFGLSSIGLPYPLVVVAMVMASILLSLLIGRFAFLPFIGTSPSTLLLASFGVALVLQASATIIFGDAPKVVPTPAILSHVFTVSGLHFSSLQLVALALGILVLVGLDFLVRRTRFGIMLRATAENPETAALMGVDARRVLLTVFAIAGLIAAVVALIWFGQNGTVTPRGDFNPTLKAFIAVVLGGLGTVRGAVIGGLLLGMIETGLAATLSTDLLAYQQAFAFLLIIIVLLLRPQGLAGKIMAVSK
jgi:branched-chain amino acid transport system permease protein